MVQAKLKLLAGEVYLVKNERTGETAQFTVSDLRHYKGEVLLSGNVHQHQNYIPAAKGRDDIASRPASFPVFPGNPLADVQRFIAELDGLPLNLYSLDLSCRYPAVNCNWETTPHQRLDPGFWLDKAAALVDAWYSWQLLGVLPLGLKAQVHGIGIPTSVRSMN